MARRDLVDGLAEFHIRSGRLAGLHAGQEGGIRPRVIARTITIREGLVMIEAA